MTTSELSEKIENLKRLRMFLHTDHAVGCECVNCSRFVVAASCDALPIIEAQAERIAEAEKILRDIDSNFDVDDRIQLQIDAYLRAKENANG